MRIYLFLLPLKWLLYFVTLLMPTRSNLWAFGSRNGQFVDNPKYYFLYMQEHHATVECVWISSDNTVLAELSSLGFIAFDKWSIKGLWYAMRASRFIYAFDSNDINFFCSSCFRMSISPSIMWSPKFPKRVLNGRFAKNNSAGAFPVVR